MKEKKARSGKYVNLWLTTAVFFIITGVLAYVYIYFFVQTEEIAEAKTYDRYYVMIAGDRGSSMSKSIHEGALKAALDNNCFVEMLGDNLSQDYSTADLMRIAIASDVDGIILEADESDEIRELINEAVLKGIPVVTTVTDNKNSRRVSFVGVSSYDLGKEFARQIIKIAVNNAAKKSEIKVSVLVNDEGENSSQNLLNMGIQDTIETEYNGQYFKSPKIDVSLVYVDYEGEFATEESVRDLFIYEKDSLPDIFVCNTEDATTSVYQAVVDYNKVGEISILGYYDSEAILKAIDRSVIESTVSIDTQQIGRYSIMALNEFFDYGYTSEYQAANIIIVNKENVGKYLNVQ